MLWLLDAILGLALTALVIGPAVLVLVFGGQPKDWRDRVAARYRARYRWNDPLGAPGAIFAWMFAIGKTRMDPMFCELPRFIEPLSRIQSLLDIGCGYGVTSCAVLEWKPDVRVCGLDPSKARITVARDVFGDRGHAFVAGAPDFVRHGMPESFDLVFILDVIHFIPDTALAVTLDRIRVLVAEGGMLVIRSIVRPEGSGSIWWRGSGIRRAITGAKAYHRSVEEIRRAIEAAGFELKSSAISGENRELWWFSAMAASPVTTDSATAGK
jgi:SAM-dependent methyltransferase